MTEQLKPCAHCGSQVERTSEEWFAHPVNDCLLSGWEWAAENAPKWNDRAEPSA